MSRSTKYPMVTLSRRMPDNVHRVVRKRVKQSLAVVDFEDPDILDTEADAKSLGLVDWGTKMGYNVSEILDEENEERRKRMARK